MSTPPVSDEVVVPRPVSDPGIEEHIPRWADVHKPSGRRVYRQIVGMFALVPLLAIAFVVVYFAVPRDLVIQVGPLHAFAQHIWLGLTGGLAVLLVGVGAVQWGRLIMDDEEMAEDRHPARSSEADRKAAVAAWSEGVDQSGIRRRKLLGTSLLGAVGILLVPAVVTLADMGPWPTKSTRRETVEKTLWAEGIHLVTDVTYQRIKASDMEIGQLINGQPENIEDLAHDDPTEFQRAKAKASIIVVRMDPNRIQIPASRTDWQVAGILCYSKICTHVGCPISLWEQQTHHLLCPCHQSTFDLGNAGVVVFGPAARALPQLPIKMDADGYLVAQSDFTVPVGPSYFERDSRSDYQEGR